MIKVNLLDSVTDRPRGGVAVIETQVANPRIQAKLLGAVVGALLLLALGVDWMTARSAHRGAQAELEKQQRVAAQMAEVNREQADLEQKIKDIEARINAIQRLRSTQQGPVAVLSAINDRLPALSDFRLATIEQKGGELIITGDSPNEAAVTQFGRSLEFSSGLFTNVNMETQRKPLPGATSGTPAPAAPEAETGNRAEVQIIPNPETVSFTIRCKYTPPGAPPPPARSSAANTSGAQQVARN